MTQVTGTSIRSLHYTNQVRKLTSEEYVQHQGHKLKTEDSMSLDQMLVWSLSVTHISQHHQVYQHDRMKSIIVLHVFIVTFFL
jgi:hypothetical protein